MKTIKTLLLTIAVILYCTVAKAYSFETDGISYSIVDEEQKTVKVTGTSKTGRVIIPGSVVANVTETSVYQTFDDWTSTNKEDDSTSRKEYTLTVKAGDVLNFSWSVNCELQYDNFTISLDGTEIINSSGDNSGVYSKTFTAGGTHKIVATYSKDESQSSGDDEGRIYNITLTEQRTVNKGIHNVVSIGYEAFENHTGITSITIPEGVQSIDRYAFNGCTALTSVTIPTSVTVIDQYAFYDCKNIKNVYISDLTAWCNIEFKHYIDSDYSPNGLECNPLYYGGNLYLNGNLVTNLVIPNNVTTIKTAAFFGCKSIVSLVIPNTVGRIDNEAFDGCSSLESITIEDGNSALSMGLCGCSYDSWEPLFGYSLKTLYLGRNISYGSSVPFNGVESLTIGSKVTEIKKIANVGKSITINGENPVYDSRDNCNAVIETSTNTLIWGCASTVIPSSVTSIGDGAFYNCWSLTGIEIPGSVTSIGNYAFSECPNLTSIEITKGVTRIGNYAFNECYNLNTINIPKSVTSIGKGAFYETAWFNNQPNGVVYAGKVLYKYKGTMPENTSITVKDGTLGISGNAFSDCYCLTSIEIPNSVTNIGENAFYYCNLKEVHINNISAWCNIDFENNSANPLYYTHNLYLNGELITELVIPEDITGIKSYAFYNCTSLTSIEIPKNVTSIGERAFYGCSGLTSVEIPNSVTSIGEYAFYDCSGLESITSLIPAENLFAINSYTFGYLYDNSCTLYVPCGAKDTYASTSGWNKFINIVELEPETIPTTVTITIDQYGCGTYCSPYALDFSNIEGLKAYSAIGFNSSTQVVTLATVMTTHTGAGIFVKGEPGEYIVPIIDECNEHTLNLLVGTLEQTTVNSTAGEMSNYQFTIDESSNAPMFSPFEENTIISDGMAYLQIPTIWLPVAAQKSLSIRFEESEMTEIDKVYDEVKGEPTVDASQNGKGKTVCDLQGRAVENPTKGIYIINGKKIILK